MADPNLLLATDATLNLLSKSSPSQLQPFQLNRSRTQPLVPTEAFYVSSQKTNNNNNNNLKPSNLSHVPCKFYKQGTCTAGANCTFSHSSDLSSESAVCKYFVKGNCKFGTKCALLHTMSPYGSLQQQQGGGVGKNNINNRQQQQQQQSQAYSFNSRRKTNDQMMNNSLDHRSFLSDAFGSSAPAVSLFNTTNGTEQLWRNPPQQQQQQQQQQRVNDFIGLRSSPRETSDHHLLNYNRPTTTTTTTANTTNSSSSVRSNNGYFNIPDNRRNITTTNGYSYQHHHSSIDDLNDAMLPSSLNDLFTPTELHARSLRQQENSYEPWRVPFFEGTTAAINIPNGQHTSGSSGNEGSNSSYLQGQPEDDDEVQFFMEDDEAVTYDHMNNTKPTTATATSSSYNFPSLISLPST